MKVGGVATADENTSYWIKSWSGVRRFSQPRDALIRVDITNGQSASTRCTAKLFIANIKRRRRAFIKTLQNIRSWKIS